MRSIEVFDYKGSEEQRYLIELFARMHNLVVKWREPDGKHSGEEDYQYVSEMDEVYDGIDTDEVYME